MESISNANRQCWMHRINRCEYKNKTESMEFFAVFLNEPISYSLGIVRIFILTAHRRPHVRQTWPGKFELCCVIHGWCTANVVSFTHPRPFKCWNEKLSLRAIIVSVLQPFPVNIKWPWAKNNAQNEMVMWELYEKLRVILFKCILLYIK